MFNRQKRGEIYSIAFSPDGRSLVSGSEYCVSIWNIRDGSSKLLPVTVADSRIFASVVFSPDGRYIAAGDLTYQLWIWDSRTHRLMANWNGHRSSVWCVGFMPDGKGLVSGSSDYIVKYWDVSSLGIHVSRRDVATPRQSFPLVRSFLGYNVSPVFSSQFMLLTETFLFQQVPIRSIAFFPSNEWLIAVSADSVRVWDIRTGACQLMLRRQTESFNAVDVSGTSDFLATAGFDGHAALWSYKVL